MSALTREQAKAEIQRIRSLVEDNGVEGARSWVGDGGRMMVEYAPENGGEPVVGVLQASSVYHGYDWAGNQRVELSLYLGSFPSQYGGLTKEWTRNSHGNLSHVAEFMSDHYKLIKAREQERENAESLRRTVKGKFADQGYGHLLDVVSVHQGGASVRVFIPFGELDDIAHHLSPRTVAQSTDQD